MAKSKQMPTVRLLRSESSGFHKFCAFQVLDPETGKYGDTQFTAQMQGGDIAALSKPCADLFAGFVQRTLADEGKDRISELLRYNNRVMESQRVERRKVKRLQEALQKLRNTHAVQGSALLVKEIDEALAYDGDAQ